MLHNDFPSPLYSPLGLEYQQAYSGLYEDLSYSVDGTTVIAALKDGRITGFGRPVFAVGKLKQAFEKIYEISPDILYMDYLEGGRLSAASKFLLQKGLAAKPYYTQIIDLSRTEEELHAGVRKSYKSLINKGKAAITSDSIDFQYFWDEHDEAAGRETRHRETWRVQYEQILEGEAFLVKAPKSGGLFIYNNHTCYYGVGCSLEGGGTQSLIWKAILHAKELGCRFMELGEQKFNGTKKELGISHFKAGFGGKTVVRLIIGKEEDAMS